MSMPHILALALVSAVLLTGCRQRSVDCSQEIAVAGGTFVCLVPGWHDRDYIISLPDSYLPGESHPLILALHGGGGKKEGMNGLTCPDGDESGGGCLSSVASREGFVIAYPDGTSNLLGLRSWNHGGGDGFHCSHACEEEVDDIAYFQALLDDVEAFAGIDTDRVFVTGFSNGAGMSHRLACELDLRIAAIAPVGGANQFLALRPCSPNEPLPVLAIHGREDPCWPYQGGEGTCLKAQEGDYVSVEASMIGTEGSPGWSIINGCDPIPIESRLEGSPSVGRFQFSGCAADTELLVIDQAGHTWPGGDQYLPEDRIGGLCRELPASEFIIEFFKAQTSS